MNIPKILIAEDESITAQHLRRILTRLGYEVVGTAATGATALDQIAVSRPDLLLADVGLDGELDGIEVASRARERWNTATVFLTAYSDTETMRRARVTEPYAYLVKPFAEQELHATIEIALQQRGIAAERQQQKAASMQLLERTREELKLVTSRLFSAQEEERGRIARDIHDDIVQRLAITQIDLQGLQQSLPAQCEAGTRPKFETIIGHIEKLANDLRELSHSLHPSILDDLGLTTALRQLTEDFAQRQGVQARFSSRSVPSSIPPSTSLALYRIAQEALQNIAKYAAQAPVNIALIAGSMNLDLSIRDSGPGFDLRNKRCRTGLGLISMAQRAESAGGTLQLGSQPGEGTRIHVRVPLAGKF